MKIFNILHFSDLHFGEQNIQQYAKYKLDFDNYFVITKETIENIIKEDKNISLVIITGDLGSKGEIIESNYLNEFFQIFSNNNIPILTCLGNHDLIRDLITLGEQFTKYELKIRAIKEILGIHNNNPNYIYKLSKNFSNNQASYIYINEMKSLFISLNSCKNIEKECIGKDFNEKDLYDQDKFNVGFLSVRDLVEIQKEIKEIIGNNKYFKADKFLVCHHSIMNNKYERELILNFLNKNNIQTIFSGHLHLYRLSKNVKLNLNNYIAGSPFVKLEERVDNEFAISNLQFNQYQIAHETKSITPILYEYKGKKWMFETINEDIVRFSNEKYESILNLFKLVNDIYPDHHQIYNESLRRFHINLKAMTLELQLSGITSFYEGMIIKKKKKLDFILWEKLTDKNLADKSIKREFLNQSKKYRDVGDFYRRIIKKAMILGKEMLELHKIA